MVRHPVERLISEYYFAQSKAEDFANKSRNLDFEGCFRNGDCVRNQQLYQLTYFCGSADRCQLAGNFEALQRAKYNVEAYYSVVGLAYDLKRTLKVLEAYLPLFFHGALEHFDEDLRLNVNSHPDITEKTMNDLLILPMIQGEMDFYHFAEQRFELQYKHVSGY